MLTGLLLALAVASSPSDLQTVRADGVTVSTAPLATVGLAGASVAQGAYTFLWLPVSVSFPVHERLSFDVDLGAAVTFNHVYGRAGWAFSAAAGPTWYFGSGHRTGFFAGPRLMLQLVHAAGGSSVYVRAPDPVDPGPSVSPAVLAGLELGYLFRVGRVVLGPILGGSVGYGFGVRMAPAATPFDISEGAARSGPVFALNLNLFKLGVVF